MKVNIIYGVILAVMFSIGATRALADPAPVDCSTAKDDISSLEQGKKTTSDKAVDGVLGFTPIGLVANVATGGDKMEEDQKMAAETYNNKIDEQIAKIRAACSVALSSEDGGE